MNLEQHEKDLEYINAVINAFVCTGCNIIDRIDGDADNVEEQINKILGYISTTIKHARKMYVFYGEHATYEFCLGTFDKRFELKTGRSLVVKDE